MTLRNALIAPLVLTAFGLIAARPAAAQFFTAGFTGDANSGISATKTYTAAVDFNSQGNPANRVINGVTFFDQTGGSQVDTIRGETVNLVIPNGTGQGFTNNTTHNNLTAGGVHDLDTDFFYDGSAAAQTETVSITGLTVGRVYKATFYNVAFGAAGGRFINVSDGLGHSLLYDENMAGDGNGSLLMDQYTAAATSVTFSFQTTVAGNSFHQYGFTNEVAPEPASIAAMCVGAVTLLGMRRRRSL